MPLISHFLGILIHIYNEEGGKHHKPHFHAKYGGSRAVYDFEGNRLAGEMPHKQNKFIEAWSLLHQDELGAAWEAWNEYGEIVKIEGLR